ncbi:MAG: AAA family ATPase [Candidatus Doudnabacteria bacterium]|nr:AAA family ATPase [Candidatus Doudnabacteria bacterium]MCA9387518.1 AAA family ATPase [Candidatus Andersenbacteria bacterium]
MYLSRIELAGFKSFANKTELIFEPGVTAIVGPNGSGKSNVSDAIRWVLGEQSMKNLRGSAREDVIFSGTSQKARLGMAEVSLVLNNEDGQIPIDLPEVVVTRRYDRSGESTYFINKSKVRLLDIQELLAKAGFAGSTYSVVGQGMIDSIVTATPKERREIFEDAAGIRPYQMKRKQALSKLAGSERNLVEVDAHLAELRPHVRGLKRQASRAEQKEVLLAEQKQLRASVYNHLWNQAQFSLAEAERKTTSTTTQEQELSQKAARSEEAIDALAQQAKTDVSEAAKQRVAERAELKKERDRLTEELSVVRGRIQVESSRNAEVDTADLSRRIEDLERDLSHLEEDWLSAVRTRDETRIQEQAAIHVAERTHVEREEVRTKKEQAQEQLSEVRSRIHVESNRGNEVDIPDLEQRVSRLQEELTSLAEARDTYYDERTRLEATAQTMREALSQTAHNTDEVRAIIEALDVSAEDSLTLVDVRDEIATTLAQERAVLEAATRCEETHEYVTCLGHFARTHGNLQTLCDRLQQETGDSSSDIVRHLQTAKDALSELLQEQNTLRQQLQEAEIASAVALKDLESCLASIDSTSTEHAELSAKLEAARAVAAEDVSPLLEELESTQVELEENIRFLTEDLQSRDTIATEATQARATLQAAVADAAASLKAIDAQHERLSNEHTKLVHRLEVAQQNAQQTEATNVLIQELANEQVSLEATQRDCSARIAKLDEVIKSDEAEQQKRQEEVFAAEQALRETQKALASVRETLRQLSVEQARAEEHLTSVTHEFKEALGESFESHVAAYERAPLSLQLSDAKEQHERLHAVDRQLMMIGDISDDVLQQYKEASERETFLNQQRDDIVQASEKLQTVIKELDATMKTQFDAAFADINEHFNHYFKILFNGGKASVKKETIILKGSDNETDENDNPIDEDATVTEDLIEITATPPGKKLTSLSMLSGGEKALTSIALILAIIQHNPSPFIVLDEVDAALDEANAERFARVIEEVSQASQFIVITHARATMLRAQALYGVTMQESGISTLLSVKLEQAEALTSTAKKKVAAIA